MDLNLVTANEAEERILEYLEKNVSEELGKKINNGSKTITGFFTYAKELARKESENGVACIEDKVVFGWAMHFFEEDSIKQGDVAKVEKKKEEPKKVEKKKKEEPKAGTEQISLFDL